MIQQRNMGTAGRTVPIGSAAASLATGSKLAAPSLAPGGEVAAPSLA